MKNDADEQLIPVSEDPEFSYDGFQVVRGEFFAHIQEPSFTFNNYGCAVNTACIKRLPDFDYVQVMVNPDSRKLAVRPCSEEEKDSIRWCTKTKRRGPRHVTCPIFFGKVFSLMEWDPGNRYKLLGKLIRAGDELLFVFDLNTPQIFKSEAKADGKTKISRRASYPAEWQTQFGVPVKEHKSAMQISHFNGCAVFALQQENRGKENGEKQDEHADIYTRPHEGREDGNSRAESAAAVRAGNNYGGNQEIQDTHTQKVLTPAW